MRSSATFLLTPLATGSTAPREFPIDSREVSIGSAAGNDLVIADPTVSRRHAKIVRRRGAYSVIDLESTNGTFVNGERVRGALACKSGDELRFGGARYRLKRPSAPAPKKLHSLITAMRAVMIFAVLFGAAFAVTEFQVIWNRLNEAAASRTASVAPIPPTPASLATPSKVIALPNPSPKPVAVSPAAASATAASASPPVTAPPEVPPAPPAALPAAAGLPWLEALNRYRAMSGLAPVTNDVATSVGDQAHARYLVENYKDLIARGIGVGVKMHQEDPANRWYTPSGARAANASDVAQWPGPRPPPSPLWAFDGWMSAPFHRLSMLNPRLRRASLGNWCDGAVCVVALNVVAGAALTVSGAVPPAPVRFPAPNSTLAMNSLEDEWPNPLSACPGYTAPSGLPITLQVAFFRAVKLDDFSLKLDGSPIESCGIDSASYVNPDPVAQHRGRDTLSTFGAVVIVPRHPLAPGKYDVSITIGGKPYPWSFTIAPDPP